MSMLSSDGALALVKPFLPARDANETPMQSRPYAHDGYLCASNRHIVAAVKCSGSARFWRPEQQESPEPLLTQARLRFSGHLDVKRVAELAHLPARWSSTVILHPSEPRARLSVNLTANRLRNAHNVLYEAPIDLGNPQVPQTIAVRAQYLAKAALLCGDPRIENNAVGLWTSGPSNPVVVTAAGPGGGVPVWGVCERIAIIMPVRC